MINLVIHILIILIFPIFAIGIINRTKSIWSGRKGPNLNQFFFDLKRLLKKYPVYSEVTSWIFQLAPWIVLVTTMIAVILCPIIPGFSPFSFSYDFIYFAYVMGLGRVFMILAALDTGSSFEGMGARREATYSAFIEPALFFSFGALGIISGHTSFESLVLVDDIGPWIWVFKVLLVSSLFVLLQIETARVPVDDPNTHLELTMIHEVMILDNSGPELAIIQYASAVKLVVIAGLIAAVINPISASQNVFLSWTISGSIIFALSVLIGLIESWFPRFRLRVIPFYAFLGVFFGVASLVLSVLIRQGVL